MSFFGSLFRWFGSDHLGFFGIRQVGGRGDDLIVGGFGSDRLIGRGGDDVIFGLFGDDRLRGGGGGDRLNGGRGDDVLKGGRGDDRLRGGRGDDVLEGGRGDDVLKGGRGDDVLAGGSGDDILNGGPGADRLLFDPSSPSEGDDLIKGFELGLDKIVLNAADIVRADADLVAASGDPEGLDASDFDADDDWRVEASVSGNVVVVHPGGSFEFAGLPFGATTDSFAELLPALEIVGAVVGDDTGELLEGDAQDNVIDAGGDDDDLRGLAGDDVLLGDGGADDLTGGSGNDLLVGGDGADRFRFDPSNPNEGDDLIADLDLAEGDAVVLNLTDILDADPDLTQASGDPLAFEVGDLDADPDWSVSESANGDIVVNHPGGSIEVAGVAFSAATDEISKLAGLNAIQVDIS